MVSCKEKMLQRAEEARELVCTYLNISSDTPLVEVLVELENSKDTDTGDFHYFVSEMLHVAYGDDLDQEELEEGCKCDEDDDNNVVEKSNN